MLKAIIFDMDGTLINSEPVFTKVWETVAGRRKKIYTPEMKKDLMGKADILSALGHIVRQWQIDEEPALLLQELNTLYMEMLPGAIEPMEGLFELLDLLESHQIRKSISTSSPRPWADQVTRHLDIAHRFEHIVTADDVRSGKPHPEAFLIPLEKMGLQPDDVVVFEDSPAGIASAQAAGLRTIVIKSPYLPRHELPPHQHYVDGLHKVDKRFLDSLSQH